MNEEPNQIEVRAIDIVPYEHAILCAVGGGKPFANTIEHRSWSEDGAHIWFLLGTHNTYRAAPDALVKVVQVCAPGTGYKSKSLLEQHDNSAFLAKRPTTPEGRAERAATEHNSLNEFVPDLRFRNRRDRRMFKAGYVAALKEK